MRLTGQEVVYRPTVALLIVFTIYGAAAVSILSKKALKGSLMHKNRKIFVYQQFDCISNVRRAKIIYTRKNDNS